jgi:tetratricopeptide (TPR) repeat protein
MRKFFPLSPLVALALLNGCGGGQPSGTATRQNTNATTSTANASTSVAHGVGGANASDLGITPSHGGGAAAPAADASTERKLVDTAELDARIKKAAEKARASGAKDTEKKAAADAYLARGNVYWSAGRPQLYKYALADFRQALKYDPDNSEASEKINTIVGIYQSMGRAVPEVSPEP